MNMSFSFEVPELSPLTAKQVNRLVLTEYPLCSFPLHNTLFTKQNKKLSCINNLKDTKYGIIHIHIHAHKTLLSGEDIVIAKYVKKIDTLPLLYSLWTYSC